MAVANLDYPSMVIDAMRRRGRVVINSYGNSMRPAIRDGARLEIRPVAYDELTVGDIVVYHHTGQCYCHRLIRKEGRRCILKGDSLLVADPPVSWDQVIGKAVAIIETESRLVPLDDPRERRRAAWYARASYLIAFGFHIQNSVRRLIKR